MALYRKTMDEYRGVAENFEYMFEEIKQEIEENKVMCQSNAETITVLKEFLLDKFKTEAKFSKKLSEIDVKLTSMNEGL